MIGKTNSNTVNGVGERKATLIISLQAANGAGDFFEIQPNGTINLSHKGPGNGNPHTVENAFITAKIDRYQFSGSSPTGKTTVVTLKKRCYVTAGGLKGISDNVYDAGTILTFNFNNSHEVEPPYALDNRNSYFATNQGIVISEI